MSSSDFIDWVKRVQELLSVEHDKEDLESVAVKIVYEILKDIKGKCKSCELYQKCMEELHTDKTECLYLAKCYGMIEGVHHKQWVIDQMVRSIVGDDENYLAWVKSLQTSNYDDDEAWDMGIAP